MISIVFIVALILLFILGVPVAFSLGITALLIMFLNTGTINFASIPQLMASGVNTFTIIAVPLFLLAGKIMNIGGITIRLFDFCRKCVGFLPGGLGHVNVLASIIFAGMSGTAVSDAGGLGLVEIKAMRENGYDNEFACALTAASSTIGPIIPPSLPMVIYGMMASVSVGALFMAGIIPGLVMAFIMMIIVAIKAKRNNYPREPFPTFKEFLTALKRGILPLLTPGIIIGGIYTGFFTPTEAAVVAVIYSLFLAKFVYKEMSWLKLKQILCETVRDSASIGLILGAATLYGNVIIRAQIPQSILGVLTDTIQSPLVMLFVLNFFLLIVGCFMETVSAITIMMPLIVPLLDVTGIDPVHFGVIMILNLMIGVLTPPFGLVLFVISRVGEVSIPKLTREILPWLGGLLVALLILTIFPDITLFLPRVLGLIN
jgi:tripartite ATP-independent transporter DctM subunit